MSDPKSVDPKPLPATEGPSIEKDAGQLDEKDLAQIAGGQVVDPVRKIGSTEHKHK